MKYESNPKHREPWQRGKRGTLCPQPVWTLAKQLLQNSVVHGRQRYAIHDGRCYCAKEHAPDCWHGHPVDWIEVPAPIVNGFVRAGTLSRRDKRKHWKGSK